MTRSRQTFSAASFARGGMAFALAATLAVGSVPATALVQANATGNAPIAMAAQGDEVETADGFYLNVGQEYTLPVSFLNADGSGAASMAGQFMEGSAIVSCADDGTYAVSVSTNDTGAGMISAVSIGGVQAAQDGTSFTASGIESIKGDITVSLTVTMMGRAVDALMQLDASALPTEPSNSGAADPGTDPDEGDDDGAASQTYTVTYYVTDSGNPNSSLSDQAVVTEAEGGGYEVTLTIPANLYASVLSFSAYDAAGVEVPVAENEDGSASFTLHAANLEDDLYFSFGYQVTETFSMNHNMALVWPGTDYVEPSEPGDDPGEPGEGVDASALDEAIASAQALEDDGTVKHDVLANAIAAASAVAENPAATQEEIDAAVAELRAAIATYQAVYDFKDGAVYSVGIDWSDENGASIHSFMPFEKTATVSRNGDVYTVEITTSGGMAAMIQGFTYGDGIEAVAAANEDGSTTYAIETDDPSAAIAVNFVVAGAHQSGVDGYLLLDNADVTAVSEPGAENPEGDEVETPDGFLMVAGQEYTLPVSFLNASNGNASMAGSYMGDEATVVYNGDGTYTVSVTTTDPDEITQLAAEGATVAKDGATFTITGLTAIKNPVTLTFTIATMASMGMGPVDALMQLDASSLKTASGESIEPEIPGDNAGGNNNNQGNSNQDNGSAQQTVRFQVGHTYEVPIAILKENSTETSMAAQYFGSTAYVRPLDNGTMEVSFSTNRTDYISGITYQGAAVSQSGATFTLTIPYTESDTVLPLGLTIVPMQQLGMGTVTADLHLYLTQATDLGAGEVGSPSSVSSMPKTGDGAGVVGVAGVAALAAAGLAAAGAAGMSRRRDQR